MNRKRKGKSSLFPVHKKKFIKDHVPHSHTQHSLNTTKSTTCAEVSREWQRCGEGFDLPVTQRSQEATQTGPPKHFGQKWIQPEILLSSSQYVKQPESEADVIKETLQDRDADILLNNSDSDSNETLKKLPPKITQSQTRARTQKPDGRARRKATAMRRISHSVVQSEVCDSGESDACDIMSVTDSGNENEKETETGQRRSPSRESSPSNDIECIGSPERSSPQAAESSDSDYDFQCREGAAEVHNFPHSLQKPSESGTSSISSCASSQTAAGSDESPSKTGLRASEWAKHVHWETTPIKQQTTSPTDQGDSAKKKTKYKKGGLADQLSRIISRDRSANRMLMHQQQTSEEISQGVSARCVTVTVKKLEYMYSLQLARCSMLDSTVDAGVKSGQCIVLFSRHSSKIQVDTVVKIFPPWQQLDIQEGKEKMLLCTRYRLVGQPEIDTNTEDHSSGEPDDVSSSSSFPAAHARWICPCSTDIRMTPTSCPAHLFPVVPGCFVQLSPSRSQGRIASGKTLFTVTSSERMPRRVLTFDTLLESIEKSHTGDKLLPCFQAMVLRVFSERAEDSDDLRHQLLIEDTQGTVALISGGDDSLTKAGQDLEGCRCCFSRLRVQNRTNRDKDPALFSAIEAAWCRNGTLRTAQSQESGGFQHSDDSVTQSQCSIQPPAFCYILAANDAVCEALSGMETVTVDMSQTADSPSLSLQTILTVLQSPKQSSRVSLIGKVIYTVQSADRRTPPDPNSSDGNLLEVFVIDHSFDVSDGRATAGRQWTGYIKVCVRPGCLTDSIRHNQESSDTPPYLVLFRDIWIVADTWIADKYSCLWNLDEDTEKARAVVNRLDGRLLESVRNCRVSLPCASVTATANSLVCIQGVIQSVDEKSAFSWDECDNCGSDKLGTKCSTGTLMCMSCRKEVMSPVQKMKMDVFVACDVDSSITAKIGLQQSTIQQILPDEAEEEGYDADCVLNKHLGPLNCVVTMVTRTSATLQLVAKELVC